MKNISRINNWEIQLLGDHALLFSLPSFIDASIAEQIVLLEKQLKSQQLVFVKDLIPAYHTLTLVYDILLFYEVDPSKNILHFAEAQIALFRNSMIETNTPSLSPLIEIPVCYETTFGLDLINLSIEKNKTIEEIIALHSETVYRVYCLGFLPGFAYMGKVNKDIQFERHASPRKLVPAGSVGIAGEQTGIYPQQSPGGWQLIGRTPLKIYDPAKAPYVKFKTGDQVKFNRIDLKTFNLLNEY